MEPTTPTANFSGATRNRVRHSRSPRRGHHRMGTTLRIRAIGLGLALILTSVAAGQEELPSVGQKVVTKRATPLKEGERVVDEDSVFRVYSVERVDGDQLRL